MTKPYKLTPGPGSDRWLSKPFAELVAKNASATPADIDVLVIGSGYGGAVAANSFAGSKNSDGKPNRVVLIERGKEYLPGSFPTTTSEAFIHFRGKVNGIGLDGLGLFDFRVGSDVNVVLANGLGGGSLINAGIMEVPKPEVFDSAWPKAFTGGKVLSDYYRKAAVALGAAKGNNANTVQQNAKEISDPAQKRAVLKKIGDAISPSCGARDAAVTVAMEPKTTSGGVELSPCNQCGDCTTGCNFAAKESLDTNLLAAAAQRGAELYIGATALSLQQLESGAWEVELRYTDDLLHQRHGSTVKIKARRLVVAAGTLGSTELLLRSREKHGVLAKQKNLGRGFSANGDAVYIAYDTKFAVNAMPQELSEPGARAAGPTISSIIDIDLGNGERQHSAVIEDLAIAAPLYNFVAEMLTNSNMLYHIGDFDSAKHRYDFPENDPLVSNPYKHANTMWFAAMGNDGAAGTIELVAGADQQDVDAGVKIVWPQVKQHPLFDEQREVLQQGLEKSGVGGRLIANPTWEVLPGNLASLINVPKGPITSTHPLGGCRMADDATAGVVNQYGQVYSGGDGQAVHQNLVVLDGAIIPSALATNPALTITAVAQRACNYLLQHWGLSSTNLSIASLGPRPVLKDASADIARRAALPPAEIAIKERLVGELPLALLNYPDDLVAELTVSYQSKTFDQLFEVNQAGQLLGTRLDFDPRRDEFGGTPSQLRLYRKDDWQRLVSDTLPRAQRNQLANDLAVYRATVSGNLTLLKHQASTPLKRTLRGLWAWLLNRGLRDSWQGLTSGDSGDMSIASTALSAIKGASHSGAVRLFEYRVEIGEVLQDVGIGWQAGQVLLGEKRLTYARPSNPWRQLLELHMTQVPNLRRGSKPTLHLDLRHLADHPAPLLKIKSQPEHGKAMFDSLRVLTLLLRAQLPSLVLQMRKPDEPAARVINRLPQALPGLVEPERYSMEVDTLKGQPVCIHLTRYRSTAPSNKNEPPIVAIHGYSASGTTYAHPSLKPSLAEYFVQRGRDVWVLDMRCSVGLETACAPWTFEHMAYHDIPVAVSEVLRISGAEQVDVVAHCMGAAMFSMAVLSADQALDQVLCSWNKDFLDKHETARQALPASVRTAVLSQVGPVMVLSDINVLRAYVASFVSGVGTGQRWHLRDEEKTAVGTVLDRVLATLPYADSEILKAWPAKPWQRTEYFATRSRMDALYGETFKLSNLSDETLHYLDDFFGTLSLETVTQVLHFAREFSITNRAGENRFVSKRQLERNWNFPTLAIHGDENGLIKPATLQRLRQVFASSERQLQTELFAGFGHQDCLIGKQSAQVFSRIETFLAAPTENLALPTLIDSEELPKNALARGPWLGPVRNPSAETDNSGETVSVGGAPSLGAPMLLLSVAVRFDGVRWRPLREQQPDCWFIGDRCDWKWLNLPISTLGKGLGEGRAFIFLYDQPDVMLLNGFDFGLSMDAGACLVANPVPNVQADYCGLPLRRQIETLAAECLKPCPRNKDLFQLRAEDFGDESGLLHGSIEQFFNTSALAHVNAAVAPYVAKNDQRSSITFGSCQYPHGVLDQEPAYESWKRLEAKIEFQRYKPEFVVLAGDQIYSDASAGLFDPDHLEDRYDGRYQTWLRQYPVRSILRQLPLLSLPDDHEFNENWEPLGEQSCAQQHQEINLSASSGEKTFFRYQRGGQSIDSDANYDLSAQLSNGVPIYLFDTRAQRKARNASTIDFASISNESNVLALEAWLLEQAKKDTQIPKLVVAPSVLLPRVRAAVRAETAVGTVDGGHNAALGVDSWGGYPQSWMRLLDFIVENEIQNVVLLSGDEHVGLFCEATLKKGNKKATLRAIHSPGLYTPYDFVNGNVDQFVPEDNFSFSNGESTQVSCAASAKIIHGNGFINLTFEPITGGWRTACEFDVADVKQPARHEWAAKL